MMIINGFGCYATTIIQDAAAATLKNLLHHLLHIIYAVDVDIRQSKLDRATPAWTPLMEIVVIVFQV